ncbi:hypothetical protein PG993_009573 [Apiospora rasikravindrae]|uniref:Uncharacterized protein n=1 Tax=Apiospora rasikravindrae TaxID=990691 RepID=A0ABR1SM53_9PEZI
MAAASAPPPLQHIIMDNLVAVEQCSNCTAFDLDAEEAFREADEEERRQKEGAVGIGKATIRLYSSPRCRDAIAENVHITDACTAPNETAASIKYIEYDPRLGCDVEI